LESRSEPASTPVRAWPWEAWQMRAHPPPCAAEISSMAARCTGIICIPDAIEWAAPMAGVILTYRRIAMRSAVIAAMLTAMSRLAA
jgi:hypothetical protein